MDRPTSCFPVRLRLCCGREDTNDLIGESRKLVYNNTKDLSAAEWLREFIESHVAWVIRIGERRRIFRGPNGRRGPNSSTTSSSSDDDGDRAYILNYGNNFQTLLLVDYDDQKEMKEPASLEGLPRIDVSLFHADDGYNQDGEEMDEDSLLTYCKGGHIDASTELWYYAQFFGHDLQLKLPNPQEQQQGSNSTTMRTTQDSMMLCYVLTQGKIFPPQPRGDTNVLRIKYDTRKGVANGYDFQHERNEEDCKNGEHGMNDEDDRDDEDDEEEDTHVNEDGDGNREEKKESTSLLAPPTSDNTNQTEKTPSPQHSGKASAANTHSETKVEDYCDEAAAEEDEKKSKEGTNNEDLVSEIKDELDSDLKEGRSKTKKKKSPSKSSWSGKKKKKSKDDDSEDDNNDSDKGTSPPLKKKMKKSKKDPNAPKPAAKTAHQLFSIFIRPQVKEENPGTPSRDLNKIIAEKYKALSGGERAKWDKKAKADKQRHKEEMANYSPPEEDSDHDGGGKKGKKKDPKAPKGPMTSYNYFIKANRSRIKEENPNAGLELSKMVSKAWENISAEEKKKYEEMAAEDRKRYKEEMENYTPLPDTGKTSKGAKRKGKRDTNEEEEKGEKKTASKKKDKQSRGEGNEQQEVKKPAPEQRKSPPTASTSGEGTTTLPSPSKKQAEKKMALQKKGLAGKQGKQDEEELPLGWIKKLKPRAQKNAEGKAPRVDKEYISPDGQVFRSWKQAKAFIQESNKGKDGKDQPESESATHEAPIELNKLSSRQEGMFEELNGGSKVDLSKLEQQRAAHNIIEMALNSTSPKESLGECLGNVPSKDEAHGENGKQESELAALLQSQKEGEKTEKNDEKDNDRKGADSESPSKTKKRKKKKRKTPEKQEGDFNCDGGLSASPNKKKKSK